MTSSTLSPTMTTADLQALFNAFNRHDIDGIMRHFAEDAVFYTIAGEHEFGNKIEGKAAIATAFTNVWTALPDVQWADHSHFMSEDQSRGVSQWTFRATNPDGSRTEVQGVDLFRITDGKIVEKQAIRKQRANILAK